MGVLKESRSPYRYSHEICDAPPDLEDDMAKAMRTSVGRISEERPVRMLWWCL